MRQYFENIIPRNTVQICKHAADSIKIPYNNPGETTLPPLR